VQVVDPGSGRGYPRPYQPPRPASRGGFERAPAPFDRAPAFGDPAGAGTGAQPPQFGPRHLADAWEGPVNLNRPLPSRRHGLYWLLIIPIIPPLLVPLYNRMQPRVFGLPFFYWYQLASVVLAIVVIALVHVLTKGRRPRWPR
jgi:hypothetical protein